MATVTAGMVKELRETTGAGMMDCKTALKESDGDMDAAIDWLRKKGLSQAAKKAGRVAAEGLVGVAAEGGRGAVVEVNAETDFVARNELFQALVSKVAARALQVGGDVEALKAAELEGGKTVEASLTEAIAKIGENMSLRRSDAIEVSPGVVATYVHNNVTPDLGRMGVLVALKSDADAGKLNEIGRQLAMHVAAANPQFLDVASVDQASIDRERAVLADQARGSGKPENIIEKMVQGRMRKYYEETVFLEQAWVMDPDKSVKQMLVDAGKELGTTVECTGFRRFVLGEGIEKQESDFAAEVAATLKS